MGVFVSTKRFMDGENIFVHNIALGADTNTDIYLKREN